MAADINVRASDRDESDRDDVDFRRRDSDGLPDVDTLIETLDSGLETGGEDGTLLAIRDNPSLAFKILGLALTSFIGSATLALALTWLAIFRLSSGPIDLTPLLPVFSPGLSASSEQTGENTNLFHIEALTASWDRLQGALRFEVDTSGSEIALTDTVFVTLAKKAVFFATIPEILTQNFGLGRTTLAHPLIRIEDSGKAASSFSAISSDDIRSLAQALDSLALQSDQAGFVINRPTLRAFGTEITFIHEIAISRQASPATGWEIMLAFASPLSQDRDTQGSDTDLRVAHVRMKLSIDPAFQTVGIEGMFDFNDFAHMGPLAHCTMPDLRGRFKLDIDAGATSIPLGLNAILTCSEMSDNKGKAPAIDANAAELSATLDFESRALILHSLDLGGSKIPQAARLTGHVNWPQSLVPGKSSLGRLPPLNFAGNLHLFSQDLNLSSLGLSDALPLTKGSAEFHGDFAIEDSQPAGLITINGLRLNIAGGPRINGDMTMDLGLLGQRTGTQQADSLQKQAKSGNSALTFDLSIRNVDATELGAYWPTGSAPKARSWTLNALQSANVAQAWLRFGLALREPHGNSSGTSTFVGKEFIGEFDIKAADLSIGKDLQIQAPHVGLVVTNDHTRIVSDSAQISNLMFEDVTVDIHTKQRPSGETLANVAQANAVHSAQQKRPLDSTIRVRGTTHGQLEHQVAFLTNAPFHLGARIPKFVQNATGFASTSVDMSWSLSRPFSWSQLDLQADANLVAVKTHIGQSPLLSEALTLRLEDRVLHVEGPGIVEGFVFNHTSKIILPLHTPDQTQSRGTTEIEAVLNLSEMSFAENPGLTLSGLAPLSLRYEYGQHNDRHGTGGLKAETANANRLSGSLNLKETNLASPEIGWQKPAGTGAVLLFNVLNPEAILLGDNESTIKTEMSCASLQISCAAFVTYNLKTGLERVVVDTLKLTAPNPDGQVNIETIGRGSLSFDGDKNVTLAADFNVLTLDVPALMVTLTSDDDISDRTTDPENPDPKGLEQKGPDLNVTVHAETLRNLHGETLTDVQLGVTTENASLQDLVIAFHSGTQDSSEEETDATKSRILMTSEAGQRTLQAEIFDLGSTLNFIGSDNSITSGHATFFGLEDPDPQSSKTQTLAFPPDNVKGWTLELKLEDYRLNNAPFILSIFKALTLGAPADALLARGLSFSEAEASGRFEKGLLTISSLTSSGGNLGLTGAGTYDADADMITWTGDIVPLNILNSTLFGVIEYVPVLSNLLTGEDGVAVIALRYEISGPLAKPAYTANPRSLLAPGLLRDIFFPN